jgi:hypothetical protein
MTIVLDNKPLFERLIKSIRFGKRQKTCQQNQPASGARYRTGIP